MKLPRHLYFFILLFGLSFVTQSAVALQLSYASSVLNFSQRYINGETDDSFIPSEFLSASFNVSFSGVDTPDGSSLLFGNLNLGATGYLASRLPSPAVVPVSDGNVTFNPDGSISGWRFSLTLLNNQPSTASEFDWGEPPRKDTWRIDSNHGAGTCNCDYLYSEQYLYTTRPYYTWAQAASLGLDFIDQNTSNNWSLETIKVPEPTNYLFLLSGLGVILLARLRHKMPG